jgi:DNA-binding response OmpR family regulator
MQLLFNRPIETERKLGVGADYYIPKPMGTKQLLEVVRKFLRLDTQE